VSGGDADGMGVGVVLQVGWARDALASSSQPRGNRGLGWVALQA
jgi:hypothetical protein